MELIGRLTKEPKVYSSKGDKPTTVAEFVLAVNRNYNQEHTQEADFLFCRAVGKRAEFIEKYYVKGLRVSVVGRIQSGSYINNEGIKIYTTIIFVEETESLESLKKMSPNQEQPSKYPDDALRSEIDSEFPFN